MYNGYPSLPVDSSRMPVVGEPIADRFNPNLLLNDVQAAPLLGVRPATLRSWRSRGIGPDYHKLGPGTRSAVRYDVADIRSFKAECHHVPSVRAALEN